jgi:hypothetical protein
MIARGVDVTSQEVLDREIAAAGHDTMENTAAFFTAPGRSSAGGQGFLARPEPSVPGMPEILRRVSDNPRFTFCPRKSPKSSGNLSHHRISGTSNGSSFRPKDETADHRGRSSPRGSL